MQLIFVYNADSGLLNMLKDGLHKLFSPKTYPCSLCKLTWSSVAEKPKWRKFHESAGTRMHFLHKDEFEQQYGQRFEYPVVLSHAGELEVFLSKAQLDGMPDLGV